MTSMTSQTRPADGHAATDKHPHTVPLWGLFLAMLALTAAEVALYEVWRRSGHEVDGQMVFIIPKFALVLLILVFTLPKAAIVLIYFMHLKFEKQFIVGLATIPFVFAGICVLPTLSDVLANKDRTYTKQEKGQITGLSRDAVSHGEHDESDQAPSGSEEAY